MYRTSGHYRPSRYGDGTAAASAGIVPQSFPTESSPCALECRGACIGPCLHNPTGSRCRTCTTECMAGCDDSSVFG